MSYRFNIGWIAVAVGFAAILAYLSFPMFSAVPSDDERPSAAPFALADLSGKTVSLDDFPHQVKIVNFWATWCHACKIEIPNLRAVHEKYKDRGVTVIGMSVDQDPSSVATFVRKTGIEYPILVNAMETARAYHLRATPTTIILDRDNKIYKRYVGVQGQGTFERDIEALLNAS